MTGPSAHGEQALALGPFAAQQSAFTALFAFLALACWVALWLWSASPYGRWLEHPGWGDAQTFDAFCRAVVAPAGAHALAWVLMIAAMMLPTTYPLLALFRRITAGRPDRNRLVSLVVAGFLAVWLAFGVLAHLVDTGVRSFAAGSGWMFAHGWMLGAAVLAAAGLFQFSALKYRCLEQCQAPFGFITSRWHGRSPAAEAWRLGVDHGAFCVGCCWALMLVMFVVGTGNLGWMLALAAMMAVEKNLPWGRRLRTPLGLGLIVWAGSLVVIHA